MYHQTQWRQVSKWEICIFKISLFTFLFTYNSTRMLRPALSLSLSFPPLVIWHHKKDQRQSKCFQRGRNKAKSNGHRVGYVCVWWYGYLIIHEIHSSKDYDYQSGQRLNRWQRGMLMHKPKKKGGGYLDQSPVQVPLIHFGGNLSGYASCVSLHESRVSLTRNETNTRFVAEKTPLCVCLFLCFFLRPSEWVCATELPHVIIKPKANCSLSHSLTCGKISSHPPNGQWEKKSSWETRVSLLFFWRKA